jgi:hypothetical protein
MAWADQIVPALRGVAKPLYLPGRFVGVDDEGRTLFALPSKLQISRCEEHRPAVEAALASHFGRPVPLRLVLDEGQTATPVSVPATDEVIDPAELVDAGQSADRDGLEAVTRAFPGAQLIEESSV